MIRFGYWSKYENLNDMIIVYILQGKMGKTGKNGKENHASKVTKIAKNENMG